MKPLCSLHELDPKWIPNHPDQKSYNCHMCEMHNFASAGGGGQTYAIGYSTSPWVNTKSYNTSVTTDPYKYTYKYAPTYEHMPSSGSWHVPYDAAYEQLKDLKDQIALLTETVQYLVEKIEGPDKLSASSSA